MFPVALTGCLPAKGPLLNSWSLMITCYPTNSVKIWAVCRLFISSISKSFLRTRVQCFSRNCHIHSPISLNTVCLRVVMVVVCVCVCMWAYDRGGILTVAFSIVLNKSSSLVALIHLVAHSLLEYLCFNNTMWEGFRILSKERADKQ